MQKHLDFSSSVCRRWARVGALLCVGAMLTAPLAAVDHREAPLVRDTPLLDINDLFIFQSPQNAQNTVIIMTSNPLAGIIAPIGFDAGALYEFAIDTNGDFIEDRIFGFTFSPENPDGSQTFAVSGQTSGSGVTGDHVPLANGGTATAGVFDDPLFFDYQAFHGDYAFCEAPGGPPGSSGSDFFAGFNVNAIVVELPIPEVGSGPVAVWARTSVNGQQVDRLALPLINEAVIPLQDKDAFNRGEPRNDPADFGIPPDVLTFDPTDPTGFPNGRRLEDDVIDSTLAVILEGIGFTSDCLFTNDLPFFNEFPYLAQRHGGPGKPLGDCAPDAFGFAFQNGQPVTDFDACVGGTLVPGQRRTGTFNPGDCTKEELEHIRAFLFSVGPGQTGQLAVTSAFFDALAAVYGPGCEEVDRTVVSPGSGATLDLPVAGEYLVTVNSGLASFPEEFGVTLSLRDQPQVKGACCIDATRCEDLTVPDADDLALVCKFIDGHFKGIDTDCTTDTDGDGIVDVREGGAAGVEGDACNLCTFPALADSDGDGVNDGDELVQGTNPCEAELAGACCLPNPEGPGRVCEELLEVICDFREGDYLGDRTQCFPGVCDDPGGPGNGIGCAMFLANLPPGAVGQCAGVGFGIDPINDDVFDLETFEDGSTGLLNAQFDGLELFEDPDVEGFQLPDLAVPPFFSDVDVTADGPGNAATSAVITHRGIVAFTGTSSFEFLDFFWETASRTVITPQSTDPDATSVDVTVEIMNTFRLDDDLPGDDTTGGTFAGGSVTVTQPVQSSSPLYNFDGGALWDLDIFPDPDLFDDFDTSTATVSRDGPTAVDITVTDTETISATPDQELKVDSDSIGSIFSDGFESGDTSAWSMESPDSLVITISSPDPNVSFVVTGAPITISCCLPGNDCQDLLADECAAGGGQEVDSCDACLPCVDDDGDGVTTCDGDCDDADPAILPGAVELCDGLDNNCDGNVDEGLVDCEHCDGDAECDDGDPRTKDACIEGQCVRSTSVDLAAVGIDIEEVAPGVVNVTPIIAVTSPGTSSFALEADILVDGVVVAENRRFNVGVSSPADRCGEQVACDAPCRVRLTRGEESQRFDGTCTVAPTLDCVCAAGFDLASVDGITVPAGSVLTLVVDPNAAVLEFDEMNNVFTRTLGPPLPPPALVGPDMFMFPLGEACAFTTFDFDATEPLVVNAVGVNVTGGGPAPNATVEELGGGAHSVTFDASIPPGEWTRVDMDVTGVDSGRTATLTVFASHLPLDTNGDGCTNIQDISAFGAEFNGQRRLDRIDVNCDGRVDVRDATTVGDNWFGRPPATRPWSNTCLPVKP